MVMTSNTLLNQILSRVYTYNAFESLINSIKQKREVSVYGITGSLEALTLHLLSREANKPIFIVIPDEDQAELLTDELNAIEGSDIALFFPGGQEPKDSPLIINPRRAGIQNNTLSAACSGRFSFVVTSSSGVIQKVPDRNLFFNKMISLSPGANIPLNNLVKSLVNFGYTREITTERPGEISIRGGILDIFPFSHSSPYRAEFFGDSIDSLRTFNPATQRSTGRADSLVLVPSIHTWDEKRSVLFSYFPDNSIIFIRDKDTVFLNAENKFNKNPDCFEDPEKTFLSANKFITIHSHSLSGHNPDIDFTSRSISIPEISPSSIRRVLTKISSYSSVTISCKDETEKKNIKEFLDLDTEPLENVTAGISPLYSGFELRRINLTVLTAQDIFGRKRRRKSRQIFDLGAPIRELSSLKRGDFVVHIDHGIGRYRNLEKISVAGTEQECLSIEYQGGDTLFVSLDSIERVQKYSGKDGASVQVNKLGTGSWEKLKARAKNSIKKITKELIALYSERHLKPGYSFSTDTPWQKSLEADFLFEETPDQERAIDEVKIDMEKAKPMDRLICGDVGFGKTEVALRASFKAVNDSKQVAILVPTTILAQQHFNTFKQRLSRFPVEIEILSRFRSRKEQIKIVEGLKNGRVDIVIGTHRLLSKDISFKDIGLLIIDEEQRFGVKQKEKLKSLKMNVDALSMSATPIPRTLQFSLAGIRDMSSINTPPKDRLPIHTEVAPFKEEIITEAIEREIERGGQIFFVHNRVKSIHAVASMIRRLVPSVRLAIAHGQMEGRELEKVMSDFVNRKYDCLVSTMIIESGLDMPSVNTLIVHRADQLGLSQLYQIRGRVGRSGKRAYAYLLTPPFHRLSREAVKRLRTIEEFTELGAGFQIARRDLEIRGAGNFFGVEQSGIMDAVGSDLYTKLIEEAVREIKKDSNLTTPTSPEITCSVTCYVSAFLPDSYVKDESIKIDLYRRLSIAHNLKNVDDMLEELKDRFGKLPAEAMNLLEITRIRILGQIKGFKRISVSAEESRLYLDESWPDRFETPELFSNYLRSFITDSETPVRFLKGDKFGLSINNKNIDPFNVIKKLLQN